jgi:hypothetical protein
MLNTIFILDSVERLMRRLLAGGCIVKLNIIQLRAADDRLLLLGLQIPPSFNIVHVFLNNDVTTTRDSRIFFSNEDGGRDNRSNWVCCSVDEAEEVADVEIAESDCLINDFDGIA